MAETTLVVPAAPGPLHLSLDPRSPVQAAMLCDLVTIDGYEPGTWATFKALLRPGDFYIDVGAHIGVFTCLGALIVGPTGRVLAFEPDNDNRRRLQQNVARNGFAHVAIDKRAVANVTDRLSFYRCADNDGGHALYNPGRAAANVKTRAHPKQSIVRTTTLDDAVLPGSPPVRLLKIDVEGAEVNVLRGAQRILGTDRPAIIAEINAFGLQQMGEGEHTLRAFLRSFGYQEYGIQDVAPHRVPLTPEQTIQQQEYNDGVLYMTVFNMLFLHPESGR